MLDIKMDTSRLRASFNELNLQVRTRISYSAAAAGATVVKKRATEIAKTIPSGDTPGLRDTGSLIRNIAIAKQKSNGAQFVYHVGVRHGTVKQKKSGDDPFYFWFLEFGYTLRNGKQVKYPFLAPAVRESFASAIAAVQKVLERRIIKAQAKFKR